MQDQIDLEELLRHMFFVSNLHKKIGQVELIDTDTFKGKGFDFTEQFEKCPVVFAGDDALHVPVIKSSQEAIKKLFIRFPVLGGLSFKNYRLVGGACVNYLRTSGYTDDIDFFPLVERYHNESDSIREGRAQQIYVDFLREVEKIYKKSLEAQYNFVVYRNEDCTTILMTCKAHVHGTKTKKRNIKIQFVHRAFDSESQMLLCSDLLASQILFDGSQFRCTYAAMLCLKSNIIPVDFSSASTSMAYRLHKYSSNKGFLLAFCGLEPVQIKKLLKQKRALQKANTMMTSKLTRHEKSIRTPEELRQLWLDSVIKLPCGLVINKSSTGGHHQGREFSNVFRVDVDFHCKEKDRMSITVANADYSDYSGMSDLEKGGELGQINVEAFIDGKQLHVYSNDVCGFLKAPKTTNIHLSFAQLCHIKKDLLIGEIKRLFGSHGRDAVVAYFDKDVESYNAVVHKRVAELKEGMTPLFQALQRVKWRMVEPGAQAIGSMRPVKITARQGYGDLYRPFVCSHLWDVKMTIISALRRKMSEKQCLLVQYLGKDIIKLIFLHLDVAYATEQSALYYSLCLEEVSKPEFEPVDVVVRHPADWDSYESEDASDEYL